MSNAEFVNWMNGILKSIQVEREYILDDIGLIELTKSKLKVVDIGCGKGVATIAIASILNDSKVIGIDKHPDIIYRESDWRDAAQKYIQLTNNETNGVDETHLIFGVRDSPEFRKGDIVNGENLPIESHIIYCRKVLVPIYQNEFDNSISGDDGVNAAVNNMAHILTRGGWAIILEQNLKSFGINKEFTPFLENAGFQVLEAKLLSREDILLSGLKSLAPYPYIRYTCKLTKP